MNQQEMRRRVDGARVARLATVDERSGVHLVPCVFALDGEVLYIPVDSKPKRHRHLRRLENIEHDPRVAVLVDEYVEDWPRLWWVRINGRARVVDEGPVFDRAVMLLRTKYAAYRDGSAQRIGPVVAIDIGEWSGWAAEEGQE